MLLKTQFLRVSLLSVNKMIIQEEKEKDLIPCNNRMKKSQVNLPLENIKVTLEMIQQETKKIKKLLIKRKNSLEVESKKKTLQRGHKFYPL